MTDSGGTPPQVAAPAGADGTPVTTQTIPPEVIIEQTGYDEFQMTYKRPFWHYIDNGMERDGAMITYNKDQEPSIQIDFGGQYVPYTTFRASMIPENWYEVWNRASVCQPVEQSVIIQDYTPMQESVNLIDASARHNSYKMHQCGYTQTQTDTLENGTHSHGQ